VRPLRRKQLTGKLHGTHLSITSAQQVALPVARALSMVGITLCTLQLHRAVHTACIWIVKYSGNGCQALINAAAVVIGSFAVPFWCLDLHGGTCTVLQ
jgi:hypothetical protein